MEDFQLFLDDNFNYFEWEIQQNLLPTDEEFFCQRFNKFKISLNSSSTKKVFLSDRCFHLDMEGTQCPNNIFSDKLCYYHLERKCSIPDCRKMKVKRNMCHFHSKILCKFNGCRKAKVKYSLCLEHLKNRCSTIGCYKIQFEKGKCRTCFSI